MNTSGTTGPSKGVLLSHAQQYILGRNIAVDLALNERDIYYNFFPLFHNTAQAMITLPVLLCRLEDGY
jgi:crotonobetaine/carnitine-CoA ligase